jgi:hypothetical protein
MNKKYEMFPTPAPYLAQYVFNYDQKADMEKMFELLMQYIINTVPTFDSVIDENLYNKTKDEVSSYISRFTERNEKFRDLLTDNNKLESFYNIQLKAINSLNLEDEQSEFEIDPEDPNEN